MTDAIDVLSRLIEERDARIVGIGGLPGSGKTTLASDVVDRIGAERVSLDDFCYSRAERAERGLRWRAMPGSHDLDLLFSVLDRVRDGRGPIELPRYSPEVDDRVEPVVLEAAPARLLLDGWLVGYAEGRYADVGKRLDLIVSLDVPIEVAKAQRFAREESLREQGGGLSESEMRRFWHEALEPVLEAVALSKAAADVVIGLDADHSVTSVTTRPG